MKYYPNPTFLQKAESIRHTRRNRTIVILSVLTICTLLVIFVVKIAAMQEEYRAKFPGLVGAATSTTTTKETTESETEEPTTAETTETTPEETVLAPVIVETTPTETEPEETEATTQNNSADIFTESENIYFRTSHPLQTITHEQRDVQLDILKLQLESYIRDCDNTRISVRYVNLGSNEEIGVNELEPVVPGAVMNLPVAALYWERIDLGTLTNDRIVTYQGEHDQGNSSWIENTYLPGKGFYMRTIAYSAIARNDNLAAGYMLDSMYGFDSINGRVLQMSSLIDYTQSVTYNDYLGVTQRGTGRSSTYDMVNYAEYLYYGYINNASRYQSLINDLYNSEVPTAYRTAFGEDALILHISGRNITTNSYTDLAIIDCEEPIIICISCECSSEEQANIIQADLATYIAQYISLCHS